MARKPPSECEPHSQRDSGYSNILHHLTKHFIEVNKKLDVQDKKLNLLVENAGLGDKLRELNEQLKGATESLKTAVEANQPPK